MHAGMTYARLEPSTRPAVAVHVRGRPRRAVPARPAVGGPDRGAAGAVQRHPAQPAGGGARRRVPDPPDHGRRLESYNTGAQSGLYRSPLHRGESLDLSPEDAAELDLHRRRDRARASRRGSVEAPVRIDRSLRRGLGLHDLPLPRAGRDQRADDRRHRPQVGDGRVQGDRDRGGEAADQRRRSRAGRRRGGTAIVWPATATVWPATATARVSHGAAPDGSAAAGRRGNRRGAQAVDEFVGSAVAGLSGQAPKTSSSTGAWPTAATRRATSATCLLPALQAVQARIGWISHGALNYICERLTVPPADAYGVATFYGLLSVKPRPPRVLHVCEDVACKCAGLRGADRRRCRSASGPRTATRAAAPGCAARAWASATARPRRC